MEGYVNTSSWDDFPHSTNRERPTSVYIKCDCGNGRAGIQIAKKDERKTLPYRLVISCTKCGKIGKFVIEYGKYIAGRQHKLKEYVS